MLDDNEKFMMKYQKSNLLTLESNESENSSECNEDEIPKLNSKMNRKTKHRILIDKFIVR